MGPQIKREPDKGAKLQNKTTKYKENIIQSD